MKDWHEHIDDYINGTLEGDPLVAFKKEVESNPSLRAAVANYDNAKQISEGLLEVDMMETISKLGMSNVELGMSNEDEGMSNDELGMKNEEEGMSNDELGMKNKGGEEKIPKHDSDQIISTKVFNLRFLMSAAAMIGIVVFAGWWMFGPMGNSLDREKILAEYTKPVNEDSTKSVDTVGMLPFEKGMHFFDLNRFEESEEWLKIHLSETNDKKMRSRGHFWLGAAHLEQWEVDEAREAWGKSDEEGVERNLVLISPLK